MSLRTKCPHCDREAVLVAEALGKNIRCKGCSKSFTARSAARVAARGAAGAAEPEMRGAVKAGAPTAVKTRARPLAAEHDSDDEVSPRSGPREESKTTLWIGLGTIGFVTVLVSVLEFVLIVNRHPQALANAAPPPPPPAVKPQVVEPAPIVKAAPKPADAAKEPPPREEIRPKLDPVVEPPPPATKVTAAPPGLYGDQGGEEVLPGASAPHTRMRARADDSFYRLDNPRVMPNGANPRGAFFLHFKIAKRGKHAATHLFLRFPGNKFEVTGFGGYFNREQATIKVTRDPNGQAQFPEDIECFLARIDTSHGNPEGVFLVSDVVRLGNPDGEPTRPRNWTPAEIARFTKEAPAGLRENMSPGVGVDTPFAGISTGGVPRRYVDPKGHLLGLEYRAGSWAGESCIGALRPICRSDQNKLFPQSVLAKEGYAVSGAEVQYRNNVDALKLHFRRIKPDGSLDPDDAYESPWFGAPDPACRTITLGDTGPRVIGIFTRAGAVVDGLALVLESN